MTRRATGPWTVLWMLVAAAAAVLCLAPDRQAQAVPPGLSTSTAFVTVEGLGRSVRLDERRARAALDAIWRVLGEVPSIAPVDGGARLLATLRLNEQVLDVTIWKAQTLVVAAGRLPNVSAILFPITGPWRHRVLLVQAGRVVASPRLIDSLAVASLDNAVRTAVGPR